MKPTPHEDDIPQPVSGDLSLAGAAKPDISRFLHLQTAWSPSLSPEGTRLAFQTNITGTPQLWVAPVHGGWPQQLTFGESVTFHQWSPTGEWIIYGVDRSGNEREGFYLIRPDGKKERELLAPSEAFRVFGDFTRDGRQLAYATTERNGVDFDIHGVEVESGADRELFQGRMGLYVVSWRPDGGAAMFSETRGEDANDLYLFEVETGQLEILFQPEEASRYTSFSWTPDGQGCYMVTNQDRDFSGVAYYDMATHQLTYLETPADEVDQVALSADGVWLAWIVNEGGYSALYLRNLRTGQRVESPEVPAGMYTLTWAANAPVAAIHISGPQVPGDIWTWNACTGEVFRSTQSAEAGLDLSQMRRPEHYSFPARDGVTLHGLLYLPPQLPHPGQPPVLLWVHGGPTGMARPDFNEVHHYLLTRGMAVFALNFRGSTGYGKQFARLNDKRLRENELYDLADAVDWLKDQGQVDASRTAIMGISYGGYLTMAGLARLPEYFKGGVALVGVSNWITALEGASPRLKASDRLEYGDIDDPDDRAFFAAISPLTYVDQVKAPILVLHGANDPRDPVEESDQFVRGVRENGGEVEYLRFPDEGHEIRKLSNRIMAYRRIAAFLERILGIQPAK